MRHEPASLGARTSASPRSARVSVVHAGAGFPRRDGPGHDADEPSAVCTRRFRSRLGQRASTVRGGGGAWRLCQTWMLVAARMWILNPAVAGSAAALQLGDPTVSASCYGVKGRLRDHLSFARCHQRHTETPSTRRQQLYQDLSEPRSAEQKVGASHRKTAKIAFRATSGFPDCCAR